MRMIIATAIGALGIVFNILIYQQKSGRRLLICKLISDFSWALHYLLLNAYSAMLIAIIGIFREFVFFNQDKRWAKSRLWLVFFLCCGVGSAIFTWESAFSLLPATASAISVISFWLNRPHVSRILAFPISSCMLTYDVFCRSYTGMLNEILTLFSAGLGIIRCSKRFRRNA